MAALRQGKGWEMVRWIGYSVAQSRNEALLHRNMGRWHIVVVDVQSLRGPACASARV